MAFFTRIFAVLAASLVASKALAFELDTVLPDGIPGYGAPFGVTDLNRLRRVDNSAGILIGGADFSPALMFSTGYDSAPDGSSAASAFLQETPSLLVSDTEMGLGAFVSGAFQQYPNNVSQNLAAGTFALGERMILPRETITVSAAYLKTQETGFALTTITFNRPVAFTAADFRASDKIIGGMFEITPDMALTNYRFAQFAGQNRTDTKLGLLTAYSPGGAGKFVLRLHTTLSRYSQSALNAETDEALAGVEDNDTDLWDIRVLAGIAQRHAQTSTPVTAPVLEASLDWRPGDLDRIRLRLAREIDDPDEVSAQAYTLTQAKFSLAHEYLRNVILNISAEADSAAYLHSQLKETLVTTDAAFDWHLNAAMTLDADYSFHDRQANFLRAANEHVVTLSLVWTP